MSIVISAPLGAGKTLFSMSEIDRISKKQPNRRIYTNIIGCTYPGVILIQSTTENPFDWRDLPNGSVLIYDEAHEHPAFCKDDLLKTMQIDEQPFLDRIDLINQRTDIKVKEKEEFVRRVRKEYDFALIKAKEDILDIGRSLTLHRHFGIDIYFITQKPERLNNAVRASVTKHLILRRLFNLKASTIYEYVELQDQFGASTIKNALSWKFWFFPKTMYKFYISAEEHPQTAKIPFGLWGWGLGATLLISFATYNFMHKGLLGTGNKNQAVASVSSNQSKSNGSAVTSSSSVQTSNISASDTSFKPEIECRKAENLDKKECVDWFDSLTKNHSSVSAMNNDGSYSQSITYDPAKPYDDADIKKSISYQVQEKPVFSGCMKTRNGYRAFTQQGTYLDTSKTVCNRLMKDSADRPFNYFKQREQTQLAQQNIDTDNQTFKNKDDSKSSVSNIEHHPVFQETDITKPSI